MIRIGIIEDEECYLSTMKSLLSRYQTEKKEQFQINCYSTCDGFLASGDFCDILFIDIILKDSIDGMTLANQIREKDKNVIIIFTTTMVQYAVKGYEVEALGYLVKPITYFTFCHFLDKAVNKLISSIEIFVQCQNKDGFHKIPASDILYIEVKGHTLTIHTETNNYSMKGSISEMYDKLKPYHFELCNQCYLVNLKQVSSIEGSTVFVKGHPLQISRPKKKSFYNALTDFCGV